MGVVSYKMGNVKNDLAIVIGMMSKIRIIVARSGDADQAITVSQEEKEEIKIFSDTLRRLSTLKRMAIIYK